MESQQNSQLSNIDFDDSRLSNTNALGGLKIPTVGGLTRSGSRLGSFHNQSRLNQSESSNVVEQSSEQISKLYYRQEMLTHANMAPQYRTNAYLAQRKGMIQSQDLILKSDHFPNPVISDKSVHIWGAPNFSTLPQYSIATVGQPTLSGFRSILNHLKSTQRQYLRSNDNAHRKFHIRFEWLCVREEPTIYLGQRPFVLRELSQPTINMDDFRGITDDRLEMIETKLKTDILEESNNYDKNILIHDEIENQQLLACWCAVGEHTDSDDSSTEDDQEESDVEESKKIYIASPNSSKNTRNYNVHLVATPREIVTHQCQQEGYDVTFRRSPLPAEGSPSPVDIDRLIGTFISMLLRDRPASTSKKTEHTVIVFNDQLGKGRSMFAATLMLLLQSMITGWAGGEWPHKHSKEHPAVLEAKKQQLLTLESTRPFNCTSAHTGLHDCLMVPPWLSITSAKLEPMKPECADHCSATFKNSDTYKTSLNLLKLHELLSIIPNGCAIQREVDWALHCTNNKMNLKIDQASKLLQKGQSDVEVVEQPITDQANTLAKFKKYALLLMVCSYLRTVQYEVQKACVTKILNAKTVTTPTELLHAFLPMFRQGLTDITFSKFLSKRHSLFSLFMQLTLDVVPEPSSGLLALIRTVNRALTRFTVLKLDRNISVHKVLDKGTQSILQKTFGMPQFQCADQLHVVGMGQPTASSMVFFILGNRVKQLLDTGLGLSDALQLTNAKQVMASIGYTLIDDISSSDFELQSCKVNTDDEISVSQLLPTTCTLSSSRVLWLNLREEPVVYIKRLPWVLRSSLDPTAPSFSKEAIHESLLKEEVLAETENNSVYLDYLRDHGKTTVTDQSDISVEPRPHCTPVLLDQTNHQYLSQINRKDVYSPGEQFAKLDHLDIAYKEFSLSSSETPSKHTISRIIQYIDEATHGDQYSRVPMDVDRQDVEDYCSIYNRHDQLQPAPNVIVNCHRGTRRSGLGLVLVTLVFLHNNLLELLCDSDIPKSVTLGSKPVSVYNTPIHTPLAASKKPGLNILPEFSLVAENEEEEELLLDGNEGTASALFDEDEEEEEEDELDLDGTSVALAPVDKLSNTSFNDRQKTKSLATLALIATPSGKIKDTTSTTVPASVNNISKEGIDGLGNTMQDLALEAVERGKKGLYRVIIQLMRALPRGRQVKQTVDVAIDMFDGYNLRDEIDTALDAIHKSRDSRDVDPAHETRVIKNLECYALLMMAQAYLLEKAKNRYRHATTHYNLYLAWKHKGQEGPMPQHTPFVYPLFTAWLDNRPELTRLLPSIRLEPKKASMMFHDDLQYRWGSVLAKGTILKNDAFMGIRNTAIVPLYDGVINFRFAKPQSVIGVGIPSIDGIVAILKHLSGIRVSPHYEPLNYKLILWFNVREEPILYVKQKPFVLRDLYEPYVNVENTGIQASRTLAMENQLRRDSVIECLLNKGSLTIHDENHEGVLCEDTVTLSNIDENSLFTTDDLVEYGHKLRNLRGKAFDEEAEKLKLLKKKSILTAAQAFREAHTRVNLERQQAGLDTVKMVYLRYPITDEQAPIPEVVKELLYWLDKSMVGHEGKNKMMIEVGKNKGIVVISNCQMGRGRTTTSMIITALWAYGRGYTELDLNLIKAGEEQVMLEAKNVAVTTHSNVDNDTVERQKDGMYACIRNLILVLPGGAEDKWKVDRLIDLCETMQNLRTVVYQTQKLYDSSLQSKKKHIAEKGKNFLLRYAMLICIGSYLFHNNPVANPNAPDFAKWMQERPEIQHALKSAKFPE